MAEKEVQNENQSSDVVEDLFLSPDDSIVEVVGEDEVLSVDDSSARLEKVNNLEEKVAALEKERDDFKNRMMRAAADLENFRRRSNREKDELRKYGIDKIVSELLPVLDDFERALEHSEDNASFLDGVKMINKKLIASLEKYGVKGFEAVGEKFLPQLHEAIQQVETDEQEAGHVVAQFQKGYHLHDRLLRAALVSVAKAISVVEEVDEEVDEDQSQTILDEPAADLSEPSES